MNPSGRVWGSRPSVSPPVSYRLLPFTPDATFCRIVESNA